MLIVLASEFFFACDCLKVHAEEHRFLMGSDGAGGSDALANDSSSSDFSGHTFVDIFGDTDQSSMSFVTNRPQVCGLFCFPTHSHCIVHLFFAHLLTFPKILAAQVDSSALKSGTKRHDARA